MEFFEPFGSFCIMLWIRSLGKYIKRNAQFFQTFLYDCMISVYQFFWCNSFFFCLNGDGYTVLICATNKNHIFSFFTQVAHKNVRWNIHSCNMTQMKRSISIRKCGSYSITSHKSNFTRKYTFVRKARYCRSLNSESNQ